MGYKKDQQGGKFLNLWISYNRFKRYKPPKRSIVRKVRFGFSSFICVLRLWFERVWETVTTLRGTMETVLTDQITHFVPFHNLNSFSWLWSVLIINLLFMAISHWYPSFISQLTLDNTSDWPHGCKLDDIP